MKEITAFYLNGCPYCRNAKAALAELVSENPAYGEVPVHWYEESESPDVVQGHSYYYVPSMFIGTEKLYEAQPGWLRCTIPADFSHRNRQVFFYAYRDATRSGDRPISD